MRALATRPSGVAVAPPCAPRGAAPRSGAAPLRRRTVLRCAAAAASSSNDWAFKRLMFLPGSSGGAWFRTDADAEAPVYGDSFIMHQTASRAVWAAGRRAAGGAPAGGLVRARQRAATAVQRRPQPPSTNIIPLPLDEVEVSIVVLQPGEEAAAAAAFGDGSSGSISGFAAPFRRLLAGPPSVGNDDGAGSEEDGAASCGGSSSGSASLAIVPRDGTMFGVVMSSAARRRDDAPLPPDEAVFETPFNDKNPRRTMKIKFRCKRCGATTIKPVNPHAWASGTVFAKCGCCNVTHKLIDNLKLFHELAGPCFGPGTQAPPAPRQERLGLRLDSDTPAPLRLRLPLMGSHQFPEDIAGLN